MSNQMQKTWFLPDRFTVALILFIGVYGWVQPAEASLLDSDFYCTTYGCAALHDGNATDVYDVYVFATGGTVPSGSPLIPRVGNPVQGSGVVDMVETGTIDPAPQDLPLSGRGNQLVVDLYGNGTAYGFIFDNNPTGYLDANDVLTPITLNQNTRIEFLDNEIAHSFYIATNIGFDIYAQASIETRTDDLQTTVSPADIGFAISATRRGNDDGMKYGNQASIDTFTPNSSINDLGDLAGLQWVVQFSRLNGTSRNSNNQNAVYRQSIRINTVYTLPQLDFSIGKGDIRFQVNYDFYRH